VNDARVVLYTKPGCHLCEDMRDVVQPALNAAGLTLAERDITASLDDYLKYRHDIPVLLIDGREVARHRITETALAAAFAEAGIAP
jgi:glutaredoxin